MKIELSGIELYGHHGVTEEERTRGQRFCYDVELEVGERGADDLIENAVDYREVADCLREVASEPYRLLEALASAIAARLEERFAPEWVRVRVSKPEVAPAGVKLAFAAVSAERGRRAPDER